MDEVINGASEMQHRLPLVHEVARGRTQQVHAEEHAVGAAEHQFQKAVCVSLDGRAGIRAEPRAAHLVLLARGGSRLLAHSDHGHLRY